LKFTGQEIQLYGLTNTGSGIGTVEICNASVSSCSNPTYVDWYSATQTGDNLIYTSPILASGNHSILISWTGQSDSSSSGTYINVDQVTINANSSASVSSTAIDDATQGTGQNQVNYSGTWTHCSSGCQSGIYDGTQSWTDTSGGTATMLFTGNSVQLYGLTNTGSGVGTVQICDSSGNNCGAPTYVDWYSATQTGDNLIYTSPELNYGSHSIVVSWTGQHDSASSGDYVNIDELVVNQDVTALTGTYYIDNSGGSGCSDSNNGTTTSTPWCDFNNLDGQTFGPGAQILLKSGDTFTQELGKLYGGGSSGEYVTISSYGTGALPIISGSSSTSARDIWVQDGDYWNVENLQVEDAGMGIVFWYDSLGHQNINFSNIDLQNIDGYYADYETPPSDLPGLYDSAGIYISGNPVEPTSTQWAIKNIALTNVTAASTVTDAVDISGFGGFIDDWPSNTVQNVTITGANWSNAWGCPNIDNASNISILGSVIQGNGDAVSPDNPYGTTGLFFWYDSNFTVSGSILGNTPNTSSTDETAVDFEAYDTGGQLLGDWIGGDAGKGLEVLFLGGRAGDYNDDHVISDDAFTGNGSDGGFGAGDIESYASSVSGTAQNNVYSDSPFITGTTTGWTQTSNTSVSATNIYNAGVGFGGTQGDNDWSYQYWNGSSDQNLTYNSTNAWWGSSSGYENNLSMLPLANSSEWMIKTWTAPRSGTVDINGWLMQEQQGGDGIKYGITQNGTWLGSYPSTMAAGTTAGAETHLTLTVAAGDQIQFQVNAGSSGNNSDDLVSWNPTVTYTS